MRLTPIRFTIWRARRRAKILSHRSTLSVVAYANGVKVGTFRRGREVSR